MKFFTAYKKAPVYSDGTIIEQGEPCGIVEFIVEEYEENGTVINEIKYCGVNESDLLERIKEEHPAGTWENFDW